MNRIATVVTSPEQRARERELRHVIALLDERAGACRLHGEIDGLLLARWEIANVLIPDVRHSAVVGDDVRRAELRHVMRRMSELPHERHLTPSERVGVAMAKNVAAKRLADLFAVTEVTAVTEDQLDYRENTASMGRRPAGTRSLREEPVLIEPGVTDNPRLFWCLTYGAAVLMMAALVVAAMLVEWAIK